MSSPVTVILLALASGLLGSLASSYLYLRFEKKRMKRDAARKLIANRHDTIGLEFTQALNEIYVMFSDDPNVIDALKRFHDVVVAQQADLATPKLIELFKVVMQAADIDPSKIGDSFFATPFNARKISR